MLSGRFGTKRNNTYPDAKQFTACVTGVWGTCDVYFAPKAPQGMENNWLQTIPGKSWFTVLRMYGPLEPWIDKTWRPGEIELVE